VIEVDKKILTLTITLLMIAMIGTQMVGTAQACKSGKQKTAGTTQTCLCRPRMTREPYHVQYSVHGIQSPTIEVKGDYRIIKGSVQQGAYDGPLGKGTMTAELIIFVTNTVTGKGWATLKNTLVIDSGPYGAGTLVGFTWFKYDNSQLPYDGSTLLWGTGDLSGISVSAKKLALGGGLVSEDGWITHP
jgi:hypothetical protein